MHAHAAECLCRGPLNVGVMVQQTAGDLARCRCGVLTKVLQALDSGAAHCPVRMFELLHYVKQVGLGIGSCAPEYVEDLNTLEVVSVLLQQLAHDLHILRADLAEPAHGIHCCPAGIGALRTQPLLHMLQVRRHARPAVHKGAHRGNAHAGILVLQPGSQLLAVRHRQRPEVREAERGGVARGRVRALELPGRSSCSCCARVL
mmetsp:Transcript_91317/g.284069  ORF Transcript_91317/g.284069 Transcript_91317/m.284069 type:complete len:203 (+) Transcript_91317:228-836(+)